MTYSVETTERFDKGFKRLDKYTQRMIQGWLEKHIADCQNPRAFGKGITANLANRSGQWKYRIYLRLRRICDGYTEYRFISKNRGK